MRLQLKVKVAKFDCLIFEQKPVLLKVSGKEDEEELEVLEEFVGRGNLQVPHTHSCEENNSLISMSDLLSLYL